MRKISINNKIVKPIIRKDAKKYDTIYKMQKKNMNLRVLCSRIGEEDDK